MSKEIEEIKKHWEQEKEAKPLLYVIDEVEIDQLLFHISTFGEKLKDTGTNYLEALRLATIYKEGWEQAEARLKRLQEAVDKNETYKRTHNKVVLLQDEELYQKRKEV